MNFMPPTKTSSDSLFRRSKTFPALLCICTFVLMFLFSYMTPLVADDYSYSFSMSSGLRVDSMYELFQFMRMHYRDTNGRYLSHAFAIFFLMKNKLLFDVVNAFMATVFAFLIYQYATLASRKHAPAVTLFALSTIFCFLPVFGQVFLWLDGACNYSWALTFELIFLYPYVSAWLGRQDQRKLPVLLLFILEAAVAGSYSENAALAALCLSFLIIALLTLRDKKLPVRLLLSFLAACGGFLVLMLSPSVKGNKRGSLSITGLLTRLKPAVSAIPATFLVTGAVAAAACILILILLRKKRNALYLFVMFCLSAGFLAALAITIPEMKGLSVFWVFRTVISSSAWNMIFTSFIFASLFVTAIHRRIPGETLMLVLMIYASAVASIAVFLFAAYLPARSCAVYTVLTVLACAFLLAALVKDDSAKPLKGAASAAVLLAAVCFVFAAADICNVYHISEYRLSLIDKAVAEGKKEVDLPYLPAATKYSAPYGLDELKQASRSWPNLTMAEYYGLESIYSSVAPES